VSNVINADWAQWIKSNMQAGRDKNGIFKILLDSGFDYQDVKENMQYEPNIEMHMLVNPFAPDVTLTQQENIVFKKINKRDIFIPNSKRLDSNLIDVYVNDEFLNEFECQILIEIVRNQVLVYGDGDLDEVDNSLIELVDKRICQMIGIDPSYSKSIKSRYIETGNSAETFNDDAKVDAMGECAYTFVIYLNDVQEGGTIKFTSANLDVNPKLGTMIMYSNLNPDGSKNDNALNEVTQVSKGYSSVLTKSFYLKSSVSPAPEMYNRERNEYILNYTKTGFKKSTLPPELYKKIIDFYNNNQSLRRDEFVDGDFLFNVVDRSKSSSTIIDLSASLRDEIHSVMKPLLEEWSGVKLKPTYVYGIRTYNNGAVLRSHRDRFDTHIVSAIINVEQDVNEDWLLTIDDNDYREHGIVLKPGDMVFYEGGRLQHGRPYPLNGKSFSNIFCHFAPVDFAPQNFY